MNKKMYKKILLGGLSLLVLAGCQKGLLENKGGRAVSFSATSGVTTKAAYGGAVGTLERIDWQDGDEVAIFSDRAETPQGQKYAVYTIDGETIQASGATSKAKLIRDEESMLRYSDVDKDPYKFVGVYPASAAQIANGKVTVTSTIPSEQIILGNGFPDMTKGTQLLSDPEEVDWYAPVSLNFAPNFTSFEFAIAAEKTMKLTGFYVESASSDLHGDYVSEIDLNNANPDWSESALGDNTGKFIQVTFNTPLEMTLPEGGTKTNEVKFGFYTFPKNITGLTFTFFLQADGVNVTRKLTVKYAKDGDGYRQGDPVKFEGGKKHNITGIVIPANLSNDINLDLAVIPWDDKEGTITYGPDAVISALAIDYISGAAVKTGSSRRQNNNFENAEDPIEAYFSVFSPTGAQWLIEVSGDTDKFSVTSENADEDNSTATEIVGPVNGRVHFTIDRAEGVTLTESDKIQLNFYVVLNGRKISMNSEITRASALTITGKVGQ